MNDRLEAIREGINEQGARLETAVSLQYRQAIDIRLLSEQVAAIERNTRTPRGNGQATAEDHKAAAATARARWHERSPYRGLVPFGVEDAEVFFGREIATAQLVTALAGRLARPGILVVTGASGSGKSSLLRAGLLPAIARGELSARSREWACRVIERPTRFPLEQLALLLAGMVNLEVAAVLRSLREKPESAHLLVRQAVETDARRRGLTGEVADCRMVLVVDQLEELFTLADVTTRAQDRDHRDQAAKDRSAFLTALHAAATGGNGSEEPPALVVVAVRGDFIDRCSDEPPLAAALQDQPFVLGPMREADLRRAITGPAEAAGLVLEAGLVDAVLEDLRQPGGGYGGGALPLLSQAMLTVWEHREGNRLTRAGYAKTGGVTQAVATSAEEAYAELDETGRHLAREIFHRLTVVSRGGGLARRAVARDDLLALGRDAGGARRSGADGNAPQSAVADVLDAFARRRLLVTGEVIGQETVQIAHEVLLAAWPSPVQDATNACGM